MDPERDKRKKTIKVWLIDGLMAVTVVLSVIVLTLVVSGYKINDEGALEQTGLLQLKSVPSGAEIAINGEEIGARTNNSQALAEGIYNINLSREGYTSWEKEVKVEAGLLTQVDYARLFKEERVMEVVRKLDDLEFLVASPDRELLLYGGRSETTWQQMSIRHDEVVVKKVGLAEVLDFAVGEVTVVEWNKAKTRVLCAVAEEGGGRHWILVNLERPEESVDLSEKFGLDFVKVRMEEAADKLLALTGAELHELDLGVGGVSEVLLDEVGDFSNDGVRVGYVTVEREGRYQVGVYKVGEGSSAVVKTVEAPVRVLASSYKGQHYLTVVGDGRWEVYRGEFVGREEMVAQYEGEVAGEGVAGVEWASGGAGDDGVSESDEDSEVGWLTNLGMGQGLSASANGAFLVAAAGKQRVVYGVEAKELYNYTVGGEAAGWLDNYILYTVEDGTLVARDFDGTNARRLMAVDERYRAVITVDNRWVYYFTEGELRRERL